MPFGFDGSSGVGSVVILPDLRFLVEHEAMSRKFGEALTTVNITRPTLEPKDNHASETELDGFDYDYNVLNNGSLDQLREKATGLWEEMSRRD